MRKFLSVLLITFLIVSIFVNLNFLFQSVFATDTTLTVDGFVEQEIGWTRTGTSPWVNAQDAWTNYIKSNSGNDKIGNFTFSNIPEESSSVENVTLNIRLWANYTFCSFKVYIDNGSWRQFAFSPSTADTWEWKSTVILSTLPTVALVNSAKMYIDSSIYGSYGMSVDCVNLTVSYTGISHTNPSTNYVGRTSERYSGNQTTFSVNWTYSYPNFNMSHFIFHWNYNGTWATPNGTVAFATGSSWSNTTLTLPNIIGCTTFQWWIDANDTGNWWGNMTIQSFWCKPYPPEYYETNLGGGIMSGNSAYVNGTVEAIYITYQNSSYTHWSQEVQAFDMKAKTWTNSFILRQLENTSENDGHYYITIGIIPNGSLIALTGYTAPIKFKLSKYSALTETNLTKIVTEWNTGWTTVTGQTTNNYSYPKVFYNSPSAPTQTWLFYRYGYAGGGNLTYQGWATDNFGSQAFLLVYQWVNESYYFYPQINIGRNYNTLLISWVHKIDSNLADGIYFLYTDDWGTTWRNKTKTDVGSKPFHYNETTFLVASENNIVHQYHGAIMDQDNNFRISWVIDPYFRNYLYPRWLRVATGTSFTVYNVTDFDGNQFINMSVMTETPLFFDVYYNTTAIWVGWGNSTRKYVAINASMFDTVINQEYNVTIEYSEGGSLIQGSPSLYDIFGNPWRTLLGHGESDTPASQNMTIIRYYGYCTNFTARDTGYITDVRLKFNSSEYQQNVVSFSAAIYNSTYHRIGYANYSVETGSMEETNWTGWCMGIAFTVRALVVANQSYYLAVKFNQNASFFYVTGTTNQSFSFFGDDINLGFPETITRLSNYSYEFLSVGYDRELRVMGSRDIFFINTGVDGEAIMGYSNVFRTYVYSARTLDKSEFYWNASGIMISNGSLSLSGNQQWCNYTRILPCSGIIAWFIIANDTTNNVGNTTTQYLNVVAYLNISVSTISSFILNATKQVQIALYKNAIETLAVIFSKLLTFSREGITILSLTSEGMFSVLSLLNLIGSVTLQFTISSLRNILFSKDAIANIGTTINSLTQFLSSTFLTFFGIATETFTTTLQKTITFSLFDLAGLTTTISSLVQTSIQGILNIYGSAILQIAIESWNNLVPEATISEALAIAILAFIIAICALAIAITWKGKQD